MSEHENLTRKWSSSHKKKNNYVRHLSSRLVKKMRINNPFMEERGEEDGEGRRCVLLARHGGRIEGDPDSKRRNRRRLYESLRIAWVGGGINSM